MTPEIVDTITGYTNNKIRSIISNLPENALPKYPYVKETRTAEICAFLGLFLYRGLYKQNTMSSKKLFSEEYGPPIYGEVMPRERFHFLIRNISFDDEETRPQRWKKDRFAAIREIFEKFNDQCSSVLCPDEYLSLDETLYPMRTQIQFKQYNPNKSAKYGLLYKSINAARYPFTFVSDENLHEMV